MIKNEKLWCFLCFEKLRNAITTGNQDQIIHLFSPTDKSFRAPIFVSWYVKDELRGNVGCFEYIPIINGITEYSITAAMKDWRYSPISRDELCNLKCTVSILRNYEKVYDLNNWEKGTHGIRLYIDGYTSTLFPNEMDKEKSKSEIIFQMLKMAGFSEDEIDDQKIKKTQIKRFKVFTVSADWQEYLKFIENIKNTELL